MALTKGWEALALKLQEAQSGLANRDVCSRLSDAVNDVGRATNGYAHYVDHIGDGDSGDVIYSHNGDLKKAPYQMSTTNGKQVAAVSHRRMSAGCGASISVFRLNDYDGPTRRLADQTPSFLYLLLRIRAQHRRVLHHVT